MAQTTTVRVHGATAFREARFSSPVSPRALRYFISPAWPSSIHRGKYSSSGKSRTAATPASSKPASAAARFTISSSTALQLTTKDTKDHEGQQLSSWTFVSFVVKDFRLP